MNEQFAEALQALALAGIEMNLKTLAVLAGEGLVDPEFIADISASLMRHFQSASPEASNPVLVAFGATIEASIVPGFDAIKRLAEETWYAQR